MLHFLLFILTTTACNKEQSHRDSVLIYNAYAGSITRLQNITDPQEWYALEDSLDRATACAFRRLSLYNKRDYVPVKKYDKQGVGEAYSFPEPTDPNRISFSLIDKQTTFLITDDGKSTIPYVERLYFNNGKVLIKTEKLDPITLQPLKQPSISLLVNSE